MRSTIAATFLNCLVGNQKRSFTVRIPSKLGRVSENWAGYHFEFRLFLDTPGLNVVLEILRETRDIQSHP